MGKLIRQKQEAGELARQDNNPGSFTGVLQGNTHIETLPDIGVTRKESSTQKQEAGELATQGKPINVPDGNIYQTLPDIGVTRKESSTQKQEAGELRKDGQSFGNSSCATMEQELPKTLPDIGVTRKESSRLQKIASIPENKFEQILQSAEQETRFVSIFETDQCLALAAS
jgi:uncharacterized protein YjiS (DUF1127 family)